ncbi:hypothetical protein RB195_009500 [Necator americanus]|uniref:Uncharacterized protein n=1 Tax=Necator americanus TaxID=51031 RepID=A0ABR1CTJ7_NECAM
MGGAEEKGEKQEEEKPTDDKKEEEKDKQEKEENPKDAKGKEGKDKHEKDDEKPKGTKSKTSSTPKSDTKTEEIGETLWCGSDLYLIIISVILVVFALFSFFGDSVSKAVAGFKLLFSLLYCAGAVYAVVKKNARIMAAVMMATLALVVFDILSICVSLFGKSKIGEAFFSILFSIFRIVIFVHLFFITNRIRKVYKNQQDSSLPK